MKTGVATFILTWNPDGPGLIPEDYAARLARSKARKTAILGQWSTGHRRSGIARDDRWFLLRQRRDRGLVAAGIFTGPVYQDPHWDGSGAEANYAPTEWSTMLDIDDRLPVAVLKSLIPAVKWDRLQASGIRVPDTSDVALGDLWDRHLVMVGRGVPVHADEVGPGDYIEGAVSRITVNRYERDPKARKACIAAHGAACAVCGFRFADVYGPEGAGFIVVHHLKEIHTLGAAYALDPKKDLRPVCANCHAMLHRRRPAYSIKELQRMMSAAVP